MTDFLSNKLSTFNLKPDIKNTMTTIVIRPKTRAEKNFLARLLKKMNIEVDFVEEPESDYETREAMQDVHNKKGIRVKNAQDLFNKLGI